MKKFISLLGIITLPIALVGCSSGMKETLGLKKPAPDEFYVISNPSLSVPPDFHIADPNQRPTTVDSLRLEDNHVDHDKPLSKTDSLFIKEITEYKEPSSDIKKTIDQENIKEKKDADKSIIKKTMNKVSGKDKDPIIDPVAEKERISENLTDGKDITDGKVKDRKTSTLENILN